MHFLDSLSALIVYFFSFSGKIAVIGGCREYTGAPYFAAISALKIVSITILKIFYLCSLSEISYGSVRINQLNINWLSYNLGGRSITCFLYKRCSNSDKKL